ncbi:hypothetical protein L208DRAFT_121249 [Tricholoma matsutake]|nr:hypothetical protein L208DRAFT_317178 [Tricholoma matsutake 945]KAF8230509.1 hypothetical protein L208DRAFT_121249 [Tricholoma matsutake 945]
MRAGRTEPLFISLRESKHPFPRPAQTDLASPLPSKKNNSSQPTTPAPRTHTHTKRASQIDVQSLVEAAIQSILSPSSQKLNYPPASKNNNFSQPTTPATRTHTHTKRQLAYLVLNNIPFSIPFDVRVSTFRSFVFNDGNTLNPVLNLISLLTPSPCRCG